MHLQPIVTALCFWRGTRRGQGLNRDTSTRRSLKRNRDTTIQSGEGRRGKRIRCRGAVALSRLVVKPRDEFPWTGTFLANANAVPNLPFAFPSSIPAAWLVRDP